MSAHNPTISAVGGGSDFPTALTTGPRESLTSTNSNRTPSPGSYSRVDFTSGLDLSGATGSTYSFTDCRFADSVILGYISAKNTRTFTYCEIDGEENGAAAAVGGGGFTMTGCKIHNAGQGISGQDYDLTDCWIGELYGSGDFHSEALLIIGSEVHAFNCTLLGNYRDTAPGFTGGMSSAVSLYTHGSFWDGHTNVLIEECLLQSIDSTGTTVYWGTTPSDGSIDALVNCDMINNTFRRPTPGSGTSNGSGAPDIITHYPTGSSGNSTAGNVYEDNGAAISVGGDG